MNVTDDTIVAPTQAPIASARQIAGCRSKFTGMSGCPVRRSCRINSPTEATDSATNATMPGTSASEMCCIRSSASSNGMTKPLNSASPSQSNRTRDASGRRSGNRNASAIATAPNGKFTRNTDRQPKCCVSHPPATGPKVELTMKIAARYP